jgi:hypothetical protein
VDRIDLLVPLPKTNPPIPEPPSAPVTPPTGGEKPERLGEHLSFLRYLYENREALLKNI